MTIDELKGALAQHGYTATVGPAHPAKNEWLVNVYQDGQCVHGQNVSLDNLEEVLSNMKDKRLLQNDH